MNTYIFDKFLDRPIKQLENYEWSDLEIREGKNLIFIGQVQSTAKRGYLI